MNRAAAGSSHHQPNRAFANRPRNTADTDLSELLGTVYDFRNTFIAHVKDELGDRAKADDALRQWIKAIERLTEITAPASASAA